MALLNDPEGATAELFIRIMRIGYGLFASLLVLFLALRILMLLLGVLEFGRVGHTAAQDLGVAISAIWFCLAYYGLRARKAWAIPLVAISSCSMVVSVFLHLFHAPAAPQSRFNQAHLEYFYFMVGSLRFLVGAWNIVVLFGLCRTDVRKRLGGGTVVLSA